MKNIYIATFSLILDGKRTAINGMIEPLLSFFLPRIEMLDLVDGPHPGSSTTISTCETYADGFLKEKTKSWTGTLLSPLLSAKNSGGTSIPFKIRDCVSIFEFAIRKRRRYDLFIGLESIYTICGIVLRTLHITKQVVYYVSDYSPQRYNAKLLNTVYLWLDRFCCYHADFIWDVSPAMLPARLQVGLDKKKCKPVIVVPNALFPTQISYLPLKRVKKRSLVFAGTFGIENGSKLAIDAMREVVRKIPDASLYFFGGNKEQEDFLKSLVKSYKLGKHVIFRGFIPDANMLTKYVQHFMVGLAPYTAIPNSPRFFADATKIRLYLGAGLPVITTFVPPLGKEVAKKGAAVVVADDEKELANAIIKMLGDLKLYEKMRKQAIIFAKNNTWENTYSEALTIMGLKMSN